MTLYHFKSDLLIWALFDAYDTTVKNLRNYIYLLETSNLHKKKPQGDIEMVEKIIRKVKSVVEEEGK